MYTIVGLGNPGEKYEYTRHNIGRRVVKKLADVMWGSGVWKKSGMHEAYVAQGSIAGVPTELILPETFMNRSGLSVKSLANDVERIEKLIVVHDDIDLPLGKIRIAQNRGDGGHNGVKSIADTLGTKDFIRVRVGVLMTTPDGEVRKPTGEHAVEGFVLGCFGKAEEEVVARILDTSVAALQSIISEGAEEAMQRYN